MILEHESCQRWKLPKWKIAKLLNCQNLKLPKVKVATIEVAKIEGCQNWKLPKLKMVKNWKLLSC